MRDSMIRVIIPPHLSALAHTRSEVQLEVEPPITIYRVLDALEAKYPMLRGTIREHETGRRRSLLRFYACEQDWTFESFDKLLPESVASGEEPFWIVASVAGG